MTNLEIIEKIKEIQAKHNLRLDNLNTYIKRHYPDVYDELNKHTAFLNKFKVVKNGKMGDISIIERMYCLQHNLTDRPKCAVCKENYVRFISNENRYAEWCSIRCSCKDKRTIAKGKKTRLERYGDENYVNSDKITKTKIERYGDDYFQQWVNTTQDTKLKRYGNKNFVNVEKCKETKLKRYGSKTYNNIEKCLTTKEERYGDKFYNNNKQISQTKANWTEEKRQEINDKRVATVLDKYHVESVAQLAEVREKTKNTILEKYGVESVFQLKKCRDEGRLALSEKSWENLIKNPNYIPLFSKDDYFRNTDKSVVWKWKHAICGTEFESKYTQLIRDGIACPKCYPRMITGISKEERLLLDFIKTLYSGKIEVNTKQIITPYELDIYIPEKKIAIEYDGLYWHRAEQSEDKFRQLNKTEMCEKLGIHLIHIFENEWLFKTDIVKNRLANLFGCYEKTIYARNCEVKEINYHDASTFTSLYHIQSFVSAKINLGLFYNNELVAVMTFTNPRFSKKYEYELLRFCVKGRYHIIGAAGKLLKCFERTYKPKSLISYADRKWTMNNSNSVYSSIGMYFDHISKPDYKYFNASRKLESRLKYQKHKLKDLLKNFDPNKTEYENMRDNGYFRIFDCGNLVFVKNY